MKNFLTVQPEEYAKERKLGRISFAVKRAIILALLLVPLNFLIWFFASDKASFGSNFITSILICAVLAANETASLEYSYRKNDATKTENYGEKEKQIFKRQAH